jgi:RNA-directed DNA polymerase
VNIAVGTARVREAAKKDRHLRFTSLLHYIKKPFLDSAYHNLKKTAAVGVDGVSWEEYGRDLSRNLENLIEEIHSERYRATPSKRTWIPKASGGERPIGIAAIEDKIVQQALVWVLEEI